MDVRIVLPNTKEQSNFSYPMKWNMWLVLKLDTDVGICKNFANKPLINDCSNIKYILSSFTWNGHCLKPRPIHNVHGCYTKIVSNFNKIFTKANKT